MKAILIDSVNHEVKDVIIDDNKPFLPQAYGLIGCHTIEGLDFDESGENYGYVDEEGLLSQPKYFFTIEGGYQPYAGNCLIVGSDGDGGDCDTTLTADKVRGMVQFYNLSQVRAMI